MEADEHSNDSIVLDMTSVGPRALQPIALTMSFLFDHSIIDANIDCIIHCRVLTEFVITLSARVTPGLGNARTRFFLGHRKVPRFDSCVYFGINTTYL